MIFSTCHPEIIRDIKSNAAVAELILFQPVSAESVLCPRCWTADQQRDRTAVHQPQHSTLLSQACTGTWVTSVMKGTWWCQARFLREHKTQQVLTQKLRKAELGCQSPKPALACFSCGLGATHSWFRDNPSSENRQRRPPGLSWRWFTL